VGVTREIADFILRLRVRDIPERTRELAKGFLLDGLGVTLAGSTEKGSRILQAHLKEADGKKEASVLGTSLRLPAHMAALAPGFDAVVPRPGGKLQPLHALYSRACLAAIEHCLQEGERKADAFLSAVSVRHVEDEEIAPLDPQWRSFFNVNSRDDLAQAQVVLLSSAAGSTAT